MKVVQINQVCYSSTGKIAIGISKMLTEQGVENHICYSFGQSDYPLAKKYGSDMGTKATALLAKLGGRYGFYSTKITKTLIRELEKIRPDVVHLHNIHGHNVNLDLLFTYLKRADSKVVWTFHDCWAFTGYCMYFDMDGCEQWKFGCQGCPQKRNYSWGFDKSQWLYDRKKELFTGIRDLTIVTPSRWLADFVSESFLKDYPIRVIPNGIDLQVFHPDAGNVKERLGLAGKKVILGVAMGFDKRKGLSYFIDLAGRVDEDTKIVLVGVSKEQIATLPENVIGIERTANQKELAQLYSAADVFVNCTLEDNFPTVNLEALACGTPVVTFRTGGSPESVHEGTGAVVEQGDMDALLNAIRRINKKDMTESCRKTAEKYYEEGKCFAEYLKIY